MSSGWLAQLGRHCINPQFYLNTLGFISDRHSQSWSGCWWIVCVRKNSNFIVKIFRLSGQSGRVFSLVSSGRAIATLSLQRCVRNSATFSCRDWIWNSNSNSFPAVRLEVQIWNRFKWAQSDIDFFSYSISQHICFPTRTDWAVVGLRRLHWLHCRDFIGVTLYFRFTLEIHIERSHWSIYIEHPHRRCYCSTPQAPQYTR